LDKSKYYVSVQSGSILEDQGATPYEFEINATEREVEKLRELLDTKWEADRLTFLRAPVPSIPYHHDHENDVYDNHLTDVYRMIYELGTEQTKKHIEQFIGNSK
jgi:hypothetical protein